EDGIRDRNVTGVQTCALPISVPVPEDTAPRCVRDARRGGDLGGSLVALSQTSRPARRGTAPDSGSPKTRRAPETRGSPHNPLLRSEERRVGKERRSRRGPAQW